jgi:hypothetical protein
MHSIMVVLQFALNHPLESVAVLILFGWIWRSAVRPDLGL